VPIVKLSYITESLRLMKIEDSRRHLIMRLDELLVSESQTGDDLQCCAATIETGSNESKASSLKVSVKSILQ